MAYQKSLQKLREEEEKLKQSLQTYVSEESKNLKISEKTEKVENNKAKVVSSLKMAYGGAKTAIKDYGEEQKKVEENQKKLNFSNALKDILGYTAAIHLMRRAYRETIDTIKELDKAFTEMAMVSTLTREEAW